MHHPPYRISHIDLHQHMSHLPLDTSSMGHYLVFWWRDIPLGQLYVKPEQVLTEQLYYQKLIEALKPALRQYTPQSDNAAPWQEWLKNQDMLAWNNWADHVLAPLIPKKIPARVPVSVVICTRSRASYLKKCLEMVRSLRCLPAEVIVVDNAPTDNSTRQVVEQFPEVTYCLEPRGGLDIARNTGIKNASAPIVAFLDDDVVTHPLWLYRIWESFEQPDTEAVTGLVIASELQTEAQQIFEMHWSFNRGYVSKAYDTHYFNSNLSEGPPVWEIGAGANMAFRKAIFEKAGYFDERLDAGAAGCNGDSEMWFRILAGGYTIRYNPLAVVHHEHRRDLDGLKKQIYYYMRGFAAAALFQQEQQKQADYKKHMLQVLPKHYLYLIQKGFPHYRFQYRTIGTEIRGILSGFFFYLRNKHQSGVK